MLADGQLVRRPVEGQSNGALEFAGPLATPADRPDEPAVLVEGLDVGILLIQDIDRAGIVDDKVPDPAESAIAPGVRSSE